MWWWWGWGWSGGGGGGDVPILCGEGEQTAAVIMCGSELWGSPEQGSRALRSRAIMTRRCPAGLTAASRLQGTVTTGRTAATLMQDPARA